MRSCQLRYAFVAYAALTLAELQVEPLFLKLDNEAKNLEKLPTGIVVTMASKAIPYLATESAGVLQLIPAMKVPGVGEAQVQLQLTFTHSQPFCSLKGQLVALLTVYTADLTMLHVAACVAVIVCVLAIPPVVTPKIHPH